MEYQFTRSITGEYHIKCSMGHEVVGRWLQEDVGTDRILLAELLAVIEQLKSGERSEYLLRGREISLSMSRDDVIIEENVLSHGDEVDADSEFDFYDSESSSACGLEDFEELLLSWQAFIPR